MRLVSFLPSATEMIARLGLDALVGRSNECTYPPEITHLPVVTAARIDPRQLESIEIDRQVRAAIADGRSLYAVDAALIDELRPDVIVTQDLAPFRPPIPSCSSSRHAASKPYLARTAAERGVAELLDRVRHAS